jgi:hypothetical protein
VAVREKWDLAQYTVNGRVTAPATIAEARTRVDWPRWKDAIEVEYGCIDDMDVIIHYITRAEARDKYGADHEPIQLKTLLDVKYKSDGTTIGKYKCRRIVAAHPHAIKEGCPVGETWAPAPNMTVTRVMHAYALLKGQKVRCWDVCVAFLHSLLDKDKFVLVKYEAEHERLDSAGVPLIGCLRRGLYGLPNAPAAFYETVSAWMLDRLNTGGWACRRSALDPCFFIMRGPHGGGDGSAAAAATSNTNTRCNGNGQEQEPEPEHATTPVNAKAMPWGATGLKSWEEIRGAGGMEAGTPRLRREVRFAQRARGEGSDGDTPLELSEDKGRAALDMEMADDRTVFMVLHVDDADATGNDENLAELRDLMHDRFGVKDCDKSEMLGIRRDWSKDGKTLTLTQRGFIEHTYERFKVHLGQSKTRNVPFPANEMLIRGKAEARECKAVLGRGLRELAGCLLWAWRTTMPLLGPGINMICKMMSAPDERTWECALWQLEYAYQHRDRGIRFSKDGNLIPHTYYDSGGTPDPTDMKSQHGHLVYVAGGPVVNATRKHRHEPASGTMGKEWQAAGYAVKDTVYVRMLMQDAGMVPRRAAPSVVTGDNKLTVGFIVEAKMTANMKHVRECYMLTREWVASGDIVAEWIAGTRNQADVVSKPVTKQVLEALGGIATGYGDTVFNPVERKRGMFTRSRRETVDWGKLGRLEFSLDS